MSTQKEKEYLNSEKNENYLKEFLEDFYHKIAYNINIDDFENFENKIIKWIRLADEIIYIELMENHQNKELWFSSIIGFSYQYGIGKCEINKSKALELYLLAVSIKDDDDMDHNYFKRLNSTIGKYLLAFYYYKDIIASKRNSFDWTIQSANKGSSSAQYQIGDCYYYGKSDVKINRRKAIEWYLKSAEGDNNIAQNKLAFYCYYYGRGVGKNDRMAYKWYLKSAKGGNTSAQCSLGQCYHFGMGTNKDKEKAFRWKMLCKRNRDRSE
ncbi:4275_t:CDS:2 [Funneliformis geosporum]|uniref:4275_t:CDS:1 n=1 Tax=Funneliformis geosporum TaxID=1117311 RepID=A0A9W4SL39_9GLOM|nr:4275_t:CDS:2 [Funneliformis geosporum]